MNLMKNRFSTVFGILLALFSCLILSANADVINNPGTPLLALDGSGDLVLVWQSVDETTGMNVIQSSSYLASSATWSAPQTLSDLTQNSDNPLVKMNSSGNAIAIWIGTDATTSWLQAATLTLGGTWSSIVYISLINQIVIDSPSSLQMEIDDSNNIFILWNGYDINTGLTSIYGSSSVFGGTWTTINISSP